MIRTHWNRWNSTISLTVAWFLYLTAPLFGHGSLPINVFLNENNQLFIDNTFEAGPFVQFDDAISSDLPGIAVLSPGNLIPNGTRLDIDVLTEVAFWNGSEIESTSAVLGIHAPDVDGFGNANFSPLDAYVVMEGSAFQSGLHWGTYDGIVPGWDSHGLFTLAPFGSPVGIYAIVVQISSPGLLPTDPFLVPFAYDPSGLGQLTVAEYEKGVIALDDWARFVRTPLQAGDANQDFAIDESDLVEAFKSGKYRSGEFASWSEGDWNGAPGGRRGLPPIGDGLFNESDLIAAFKNGLFRTGDYSAREVQTINVSEPNGSPRIIATIIGCIVLRIMGLRVICDSKAPPESRAST